MDLSKISAKQFILRCPNCNQAIVWKYFLDRDYDIQFNNKNTLTTAKQLYLDILENFGTLLDDDDWELLDYNIRQEQKLYYIIQFMQDTFPEIQISYNYLSDNHGIQFTLFPYTFYIRLDADQDFVVSIYLSNNLSNNIQSTRLFTIWINPIDAFPILSDLISFLRYDLQNISDIQNWIDRHLILLDSSIQPIDNTYFHSILYSQPEQVFTTLSDY
jgi:hypothetical protein